MSKKVVAIASIAIGIAMLFVPGVREFLVAKEIFTATTLAITGAGLVVSGASSLLIKAPRFPDGFGQLYPTQGGVQPRTLLFGMFATPGNKVFELTSDDGSVLWQVFVLGIGQIDAITKATTVEGETLFISDLETGQVSGRYSGGTVRLYTRLGTDGQPAISRLRDEVAQWTDDHQLNGLAYVAVRQELDPEILTAPLSLKFHGRGLRVYDPRDDDTAGGTGDQRRDDPVSWGYSENPVLCALTYCIGWRQGTSQALVAGMGLPASRTSAYGDEIIASANVADETVTTQSPAGQEPRYRACGVMDASADHLTNLQHFEIAMAGHITLLARGVRILAGAWMPPVVTLGAGDVLSVGRLQTVKSKTGLVNTVGGTFANTASDMKLEEYPKARDDAAFAADGQELMAKLSLPFTPTHSAAQRLAHVALKASRTGGEGGREPRTLTLSTKLSGLQVEPGDIVTLDLPYLMDAPCCFRVRDRVIAVDDRSVSIDFDLVEETEAVWAWAASDEAAHFETPVLPTTATLPAVTGFAGESSAERSIGGIPVPGILVSWSAETHSGLGMSELRLRPSGAASAPWVSHLVAPAAGGHLIAPVTPDVAYDLQMRHQDVYGAAGAWSSDITVMVTAEALDIPWSAVGGADRPEDGATDGAIPGTNIYDPDTGAVLPREALITADAALALLPVWDFDATDTTQWTGDNLTIVPAAGGYQVTTTGTDAKLISPSGLQVVGAASDKVAVKLRRVGSAGGVNENVRLFFATDDHGFSAANSASLVVNIPANAERVLVFDMAGIGDWSTSTIQQIRFDPSTTVGDVFFIDYIGIGRASGVPQAPESVNRVGTSAALFDIAAADTAANTSIAVRTLSAMGLSAGDQISCGLQVVSPGSRRGLLSISCKDTSGTTFETHRSTFSVAGTADYQRVTFPGLVIPAGTVSIAFGLQREDSGTGAVGARGLTVNLGGRSAAWRDERADWSTLANDDGNKPENGATLGASWGANIAGQPSDSNLLNSSQQWSDIAGSGKPADFATRNTGALADRNTVGTDHMDVYAVTEPQSVAGSSGTWSLSNSQNVVQLAQITGVPVYSGSQKIGVTLTGSFWIRSASGVADLVLYIRRNNNLNAIHTEQIVLGSNYQSFSIQFDDIDRGSGSTNSYQLLVGRLHSQNVTVDVGGSALKLRKFYR